MESDGEDASPAAPHPCGAGHRASHSLPTSAGGRVCLSCAAALLSSAASAPSHHVAHALANLSLALADPAFLAPLRTAHPRFLAGPLAEVLVGAAARRDAALAAQACDLRWLRIERPIAGSERWSPGGGGGSSDGLLCSTVSPVASSPQWVPDDGEAMKSGTDAT